MTADDKKPREFWKPIPGCKTHQISSLGRFRSARGITVGTKNSRGYYIKTLPINGRRQTIKTHRMVLLAFYGPSDLMANHKNGIKTDNRLENLEYVTAQQNVIHAIKTGLNPTRRGEKHGSAKIRERDAKFIIKQMLTKKSTKEDLSKKFGISPTTVYNLSKGYYWKCLDWYRAEILEGNKNERM